MPAEAIPVVAAVVAVFALFMVVVGGTALWTALPRRGPGRSPRRDTDRSG